MLKNHYWDYLLFAFLGLLAFTWFKPDTFISTTVFGWRVDFFRYLKITLFVWDGLVSTGFSAVRNTAFIFPHIIYGALTQLFFGLKDSLLYEKLLFYICFAGSGISAYYFLKTLKLKRVPCLLGALFYMFNTFGTVVVWFLAIGFSFPFYAFFPLLLALYIRVLRGEFNVVLAVGIGFLTPATSAFNNPALFLLFWGVAGVYTLSLCAEFLLVRDYISIRKVVLRALQFGLLFVLLNSFWILPLLGDLRGQYALASNENMELVGDFETLQRNSVRMRDGIRLQGLWSFYGRDHGDPYYPWARAFKTPLFGLLSYIPLLIAGLGVRMAWKSRRLTWLVWPFLLVVCLLLTSGMYSSTYGPNLSPLAVLLRIFYSTFPFLARAFRGGYTKYGFVLTLVLTTLLAYGVKWLGNFCRAQLLLLLTIPILILGFPLITGEVIFPGGQFLKSSFVKIPEDYRRFEMWDRGRRPVLDRYLSLPLFTNYNTFFDWEEGFCGRDYLPDFSTRAVISDATLPLVKVVGQKVDQGAVEAVKRLGGLLNVGYLVFRGDASWRLPDTMFTQSPQNLERFLESFDQEEQFGNLRIYPVDNQYFLPRIFAPEQVVVSQGGLMEFPQRLSLGRDYPVRTGWYLVSGGLDEGYGWSTQPAVGFIVSMEPITPLDAPPPVSAWDEGWAWPEATVSPSDWKYPLVRWRERWAEWGAGVDPLQGTEILLWHGAKRVAELTRWGSKVQVEPLVKAYTEQMQAVISALRAVPEEEWDAEYWEVYQKALAYAGRARDYASEVDGVDQGQLAAPAAELRERWEGLAVRPCEQGSYCYILRISERGEYDLYADLSGRGFGEEWGLGIETEDSDFISYQVLADEGSGPVHFGKSTFEKGVHTIWLEGSAVVEPTLLLRRVGSGTEKRIPHLSFSRINPTKYKVKVSGATDPYHLVLNEGFHDGWQLFPTNSSKLQADSLSNRAFSILGRVGEKITSLFLDNGTYGPEVASYFNGEIKEMTHRNTFLEPATFETWGEEPLASEHLEVNGYANSWYVQPEDVGGAEDYELIIEFGPQRWFYTGLGISILTLLSSILYLGWRRLLG